MITTKFFISLFVSDCSVILLLKTDDESSGENQQQQQEKIVLVPWIDLTKISEKKEEETDYDDDKKVEIQKQQQQRYQKIREQLLLPKGRLSQAATPVSGSGDYNNDRVDLTKRKAQVIDLLQRHQIQVTQEDESEPEDTNNKLKSNNQQQQQQQTLIIQGGLARLRPPYRQFEASNVIVLDRLNSLLDQMPGQ